MRNLKKSLQHSNHESLGTLEERRFQWVQRKLNTRESSTLVIATVASSASLVLFAMNPPPKEAISWMWAGFSLPITGFLYRELTFLTIDYQDLGELYLYLRGKPKSPRIPKLRMRILNWCASQFRRFLLRVFFLFPSGLWLVDHIWANYFNGTELYFGYPLAVIITTAIIFGILEWYRNHQLEIKHGTYLIQ